MRPILTAALILLFSLLTACSLLPEPYKVEVTQGTVLEQKEIDKLKIGMTKEQVKFILGSPSIQDMFNPNRWDYIHYVDQRTPDQDTFKRLIAYFENDKLNKIEGDFELSE